MIRKLIMNTEILSWNWLSIYTCVHKQNNHSHDLYIIIAYVAYPDIIIYAYVLTSYT